MSMSTRALTRSFFGLLDLAALAGTFSLGAVVAQQQMPSTKVTALMKQTLSDVAGREVATPARVRSSPIPPARS